MGDEWSLATLKEYFETMLKEREKRRDEQHRSLLVEMSKAEQEFEHRVELLNRHWEELQTRVAGLVTREEFDALERRYEERHAQVEIEVRLLQARVVPMLWVGSTLAIATIGVFISHIVLGRPF